MRPTIPCCENGAGNCTAKLPTRFKRDFPKSLPRSPKCSPIIILWLVTPKRRLATGLKAGRRAAERSANREAVRHLESGLEVLKELAPSVERDRLELALQIAITTPMTAITGFGSPESDESYARARELCESLGAAEQLVTVLHGQWVRHTVGLAHRDAEGVAAQLLRLGEQHDSETARMIGHRMSGWTALFRGNLDITAPHLDQALSIYDRDREKFLDLRLRSHHDHRVAVLSCRVIHQWLSGYPDQARETRAEAIAYARELEHVATLAYALLHAGCLLGALSDDSAAVREFGDELLTLANAQGLPTYQAAGTVMTGWAVGNSGRLDAGMAQLREGLASVENGGARYFLPCYFTLLVRLYLAAGAAADARRTLENAKQVAEASGERMWKAELCRLTGEVLLRSDSNADMEAEQNFRQAIEIARRIGAKSPELRAATSLARLWESQGKHDQARDILRPVYGWLTEGFDSGDLKAANALLSRLA